MALRAKKPVLVEGQQRFKGLFFGEPGSGKSHFATNIPQTYYIDTEGIEKYEKYKKFLIANGSEVVKISELSEIVEEVTALLNDKHDYKTLVIDSLSWSYSEMCTLEGLKMGVEFGRHKVKANMLLMRMGMLIERLDMNVILLSHETAKYEEDKEIGKKDDLSDKMRHAVGTTCRLTAISKGHHKLRVIKSRYEELEQGIFVDFNDGYGLLKSSFGEEMFLRESKPVELINADSLKTLVYLISTLQISDDVVQKALLKNKASKLEELPQEYSIKWIEFLQTKQEKAA